MKEIKAFIRPEKLNVLAEKFKKEQFCCFTIFEGEGVGTYADPETSYPSLKFPYLHNKVVKLEIVCDDENVDTVIETIKNYAHTGNKGDGIIYVSNVDYKVKVRTGERTNSNINTQKE